MQTRGKTQGNSQQYTEGSHVEYHPIGGSHGPNTTTGIIQRVITEDEITGSAPRTVHASAQDPHYLILNDHTQKETAVSHDSVIRVVQEPEVASKTTEQQQQQQGQQQAQQQQAHVLYKEGQKVRYHVANAETTGVIRKVLLRHEITGTRHVTAHADPEHPQYLIANDSTGKENPVSQEVIIEAVNE